MFRRPVFALIAMACVSLSQAAVADEGAVIGGMNRAEAKAWWAFQPLPEPGWHPSAATIDAFLDRELEARSLDSSDPTDKRALIRRATYDLTGLPPTPEAVVDFLADEAPEAFAKVIERLLASPDYGVRWGRLWLDVVRYADTAGENSDRPLPHAWRYRNWVIDSFNRDLSFREFARLQIGGDLLRAGESLERRNEGVIATGYLAVARRFGHDIDHNLHLMNEDVIDNLGKSFLGLSLGCARCHDHKYDAVSMKDYYALYGIFSSTLFSFPGCEPRGQPKDLIPLIDPKQAAGMMADFQKRKSAFENRGKSEMELAARIKLLAEKSYQVLTEARVAEAGSTAFGKEAGSKLERFALRKGEVLQLAVLPNGGHGADSTLVEWKIAQLKDGGKTWSTADLIPVLTQGDAPVIEDRGAAWLFMEVTDGPVFLREKHDQIAGHSRLKKWGLGDTPSVFVNAGEQLKVWTTLPARTFFVHPGPKRTVAVAWVCPEDGDYRISGRVADAHPAGLDGVSYRLEHFASDELGPGLVAMGRPAEKAVMPERPVYPVAYAVRDNVSANTRVQRAGDPENLGEEIARRWLEVFGGDQLPHDAGSGRAQLADWVTNQPLFARVTVNRIWLWHFGRGLVASPNDFGARGRLPTHPELLDWLAARFVASGYSVKAMHRLIMQTRAYRRDFGGAALADKDPDNRWLARFERRRLTAEELRDSLLFVSGRLDPTPGRAHPFPKEETWKFSQHNPFNAVYPTNRRSVYLMRQRQRNHPFLNLFDGADPNASTPARRTTTAPTQALYFMNDPFFHEQAAAAAERLLKAFENDRERIAAIYERLLQRPPTDDEISQAMSFVKAYPASLEEKWSAFARLILAGNEFLHVD